MGNERVIFGQVEFAEVLDVRLRNDGEWLRGETLHLHGDHDDFRDLLPDRGAFSGAVYEIRMEGSEDPPTETATTTDTRLRLEVAVQREFNEPVEYLLHLEDAATDDRVGMFRFEEALGEHRPPWVRTDDPEPYLTLILSYDHDRTKRLTDFDEEQIEQKRRN